MNLPIKVKDMVIDLRQCAALIKEHNEFVIISHEHPDGDTLGSAFALAEILRIMGKKRVVKCSDIIPKDFYYMTDSYIADDVTDPFIVTVDVADEKLLGNMASLYGGRVDLCIDHHVSNTYYAKNTFVEDRAAACGIIYELALELGIEPNLYMRECIYTGISTDTGCFRYQNTTPQTLRIAADLMEKGIDSKKINKLMFETKTKSLLHLELLARNTLEYYFDGRCAIITLTQAMYKESGSAEHECYSITALPRQIEGVLVGAVIKEKEDGTFGISVRTEGDIDASEICSKMNGGGHKGAAGASFSCSYEEGKAQLLNVIKTALDGLNQ